MIKNWKTIRIIFLVLIAIMQWFSYILELQVLSDPKVKLDDIVSISIYVFFGVSLLIIISTIHMGNGDKRREIDWNETIFTLSNPVQIFNYVGWVLVASVIIPTLHSYIADSRYLIDNIFMLSLGISIILSTYFTAFLFKNVLK